MQSLYQIYIDALIAIVLKITRENQYIISKQMSQAS